MTLSDKVVAFRKYLGWSRAKTCEILNIPMAQLREIENKVFRIKNGARYGNVNDTELAMDDAPNEDLCSIEVDV